MILNKNYLLKISLGLLLITLLVTGCSLQGSLSLTITPNPIVFTYENQSVDTTITLTTGGFGQITIDQFIILVLDGEEEIFTQIIEVNETIDFSVPGVSHQENYVVNLSDVYDQEITEAFYNDNLKGTELTIKITIAGSTTTTTQVPIQFN
ncbi:MAG: hypothetical protein K9K32_05625 [Halanaerobiales bacterium]|nr:hypothetical protein [Halanaerobiales bacterium]